MASSRRAAPKVDRSRRSCKDCLAEGITTKRKAPHPGPRCATHHRALRKKRRDYSHKQHVEETYNITYDQYWAIYKAQGGKCYVCRRATGARRKLSVDHDHACCNGPNSCGKCVRGLLCSKDNEWLGHIRDEADVAQRVIDYLANPPARQILD